MGSNDHEEMKKEEKKLNIMVMIPTARGISHATVSCLFNLRTEIEKLGHWMHLASLERMPLDLARNELATVFLSTTCDMALCMDDDVAIAPELFFLMLEAASNGCDIISAPCKMRSEGNLFNVVPTTAPEMKGKARVVECAWTGFGAVLVKRAVWQTLFDRAVQADLCSEGDDTYSIEQQHTYRSTVMPERTSAAFFRSRIEPAKTFDLSAPEGLNVYLLDDRAFSLRAHEAGFKIHACIDIATEHAGLKGCFALDLERFQRSQASQARKALVGPDGKAIK